MDIVHYFQQGRGRRSGGGGNTEETMRLFDRYFFWRIILLVIAIDLYKIGRANYLPMTYTTNWAEYTHRVIELVNRLGAKHYIKKDLQPYLPVAYHNPQYITQHH